MTDLEKGMEAFNNEDYKTAYNILKPLAVKGDAQAEFALGYMFEKGKGIPQHHGEMIKWYQLASNKGFADAQFIFGLLCYNGKCVELDVVRGESLLVRAAEQGHAGANYHMGLINEKKGEDSINKVRAHMCYNLSASNGHEDAMKARDEIAKKMKPAELNEAQNIALSVWEKI